MKKAMSLLTATAMAATLLAGCGGGAASSSAASKLVMLSLSFLTASAVWM